MFDRMVPKEEFEGLISTTEMLVQPLLEITAIGENGPFLSWSAMATELGWAGPVLQAGLRSTAFTTMKSVGLDWEPSVFWTSRANLCGTVRNGAAGTVTVSSRSLTN